MHHEPLLLATLLGVLVGVVLGVGLSYANLSPVALDIIGLPGELLMRMLKMLVLPLITASVMAGGWWWWWGRRGGRAAEQG